MWYFIFYLVGVVLNVCLSYHSRTFKNKNWVDHLITIDTPEMIAILCSWVTFTSAMIIGHYQRR